MDIYRLEQYLPLLVITYLIGLGAKLVPGIKDNFIPVIVGVAGGALGIVGMYVIADFPATDVLNAIAVGIVSGLASTGVHQAYKQTRKVASNEDAKQK